MTTKTTQSNSHIPTISTRYWRSLIWRMWIMGLNVIQRESNDGLAINEQNRISNATYITKLMDVAYATWPDILYATIMMAQFTKNPSQENWTGVKRFEIFKRNYCFWTHLWRTGGELGTRAHPLCRCRWWNKPAPQIDQWLCVHNRKGCLKLCANRVMWPTQKVICRESLPPPKLVGFSLLIKHALPTATTRLYIAILFRIETHMTAVYGRPSTAKYGWQPAVYRLR